MNAKIFISYSESDKNKLIVLRRAINKLEGLEPIVVANRRKVGQTLTKKVKECMEEANILIPILTRASISSQWVNQEIGFAEAKPIKIVPLVEKSILDELKGFIHKQIELPFVFDGNKSDSNKEARNFRKCYLSALEYITVSSKITPTHPVRLGKLKITKPTESFV